MTDDADLPDERGPERTCIVTRRKGAPEGLIRFVVGPGEVVVPDVRARLPGRGAWVEGESAVLDQAVRRKAFARAFRRQVTVPDGLIAAVDGLLAADALQALGLANKAGRLVCGTVKVESALAAGKVAALVQALEAAADGMRKLEGQARRLAASRDRPVPIAQLFESHQMDLALGRSHVIHAALLIGGASDAFLKRAARLSRFRGAGLREVTATVSALLPDEAEAGAQALRVDPGDNSATSPL